MPTRRRTGRRVVGSSGGGIVADGTSFRRSRTHPPRVTRRHFRITGRHGVRSAARMTAVRRYEATVYDSNRWDGFELRRGDIIISTPPKCGTTWAQMICARRGWPRYPAPYPDTSAASTGSTSRTMLSTWSRPAGGARVPGRESTSWTKSSYTGSNASAPRADRRAAGHPDAWPRQARTIVRRINPASPACCSPPPVASWGLRTQRKRRTLARPSDAGEVATYDILRRLDEKRRLTIPLVRYGFVT
jgi:hypothetical protein